MAIVTKVKKKFLKNDITQCMVCYTWHVFSVSLLTFTYIQQNLNYTFWLTKYVLELSLGMNFK